MGTKEQTAEYIQTTVIPYCKGISTFEESGRGYDFTKTYIPLYDADGYFTYVYLEYETYLEDKFNYPDSLATYTGILTPGSLPGTIRDQYMNDGEVYSVLQLNTDPSSKKMTTYVLLSISIVGFLVFFIL